MNRPYLILFFAIAFFGVLVAAGVYQHYRVPEPERIPATQPLVERLREERERRLRQQHEGGIKDSPVTTTSAPSL